MTMQRQKKYKHVPYLQAASKAGPYHHPNIHHIGSSRLLVIAYS